MTVLRTHKIVVQIHRIGRCFWQRILRLRFRGRFLCGLRRGCLGRRRHDRLLLHGAFQAALGRRRRALRRAGLTSGQGEYHTDDGKQSFLLHGNGSILS